MSLCYIYDKTTHCVHRDELLSSFENSVSLDVSAMSVLADFPIYIVELETVNKSISLKIKSLFEVKISPLIYFVVPEKHSLMLFQLAFLVQAKTIITIHQDTAKVVKKLKSDLVKHNSVVPLKRVEELKVNNDESHRVASRINFVEFLKDKLLEKMISNKSYYKYK